MAEEKAACLRNSESLNITISSPCHSYSGENSTTGGHAPQELDLMTSKLNSEMIDFLNPHPSSGFSVTRSLAQELRSSREMKSRGKVNEAITKDKPNHIHTDREAVRSSDGVGTSNTMTGTKAVVEESDRISNPDDDGDDDDDDLIFYSKSCHLKGKMPNVTQKDVNLATDLGLSDINNKDLVTKENHQKLALIAETNIGDPELAESPSPSKQMEKVLEPTTAVSSSKSPRIISADKKIIRTTKHISNFSFFHVRYSGGANVENGSQQVQRISTRCLEKGKEKVLYSEEDCCSKSKEREDSNESVESNSRKVISKGKRAQNADFISIPSCKRSKQECGRSSSSEHLFRKESSFMNWISSITSSYSRCDRTNKALGIVPQDCSNKGYFGSIPKLEEESEGVKCQNKGFASIFRALYSPGIMVQNSIQNRGHMEEANDSVQLNVSNPPTKEGPKLNLNGTSIQIEQINSVLMPHEVRPLVFGNLCNEEAKKTCARELNQDNTPSIISSSCERIIHAARKTCIPRITGPPYAEEDGNQARTFALNNSLNNDFDRRNGFFQSSWIDRLLRKDSPSILQTSVCRLDMDLVPQKLKSRICMEDEPDQGISSLRKPGVLMDACVSHVKSQRLINTSPELQPCPVSHTVSSGSKRPEDQKSKHYLTPILPRQKFKRSGRISSLFAKRLDAFRHIMPSKVADDMSCAANTCFFCGKVGHRLRNCSSLVESDLKNLMEFLKSYKGNELPTSFCIRCFQGNHWAIACPHISMKMDNNMDSPPAVNDANLNRANKTLSNQGPPNYDRRMILWSGDNNNEHQQHGRQNSVPQRVDSPVEVDPVSSNRCRFHETSPPVANKFYRDLSKECLSKDITKSKQNVSVYLDNEAKGTEVGPLCEFVGPKVDDKQNENFKAIRKLRLSRTEIMRLLKSQSSRGRLEGFYLRLRLGKWDEGLGGTGYRVALINGVSHENCVSVCIGHLTQSVNCRFVSNQDYNEDELKAWWSAATRGEGKLPSKEELNKKLKERMELEL